MALKKNYYHNKGHNKIKQEFIRICIKKYVKLT